MTPAPNTDATTIPGPTYFTRFGGSAPDNYERYFVPAIGAPLAADLVEFAALRRGERVLDVACGTGIVARLAAGRIGPAGSVAGLDANPAMLAVARTAASNAAIAWHEAPAERMPFADAAFNVVLCQLGLQFMGDKTAALGEMRRVLASSGRLALNVPGPMSRPFTVLDDALTQHVGRDAGAFVRAVFALHDGDELHRLVDGAGFRGVVVRSITNALRFPSAADFLWQYVHSTPLAAMVAQLADDRRSALERDVVERLEPFVEASQLRIQQPIIVVTAQRDA